VTAPQRPSALTPFASRRHRLFSGRRSRLDWEHLLTVVSCASGLLMAWTCASKPPDRPVASVSVEIRASFGSRPFWLIQSRSQVASSALTPASPPSELFDRASLCLQPCGCAEPVGRLQAASAVLEPALWRSELVHRLPQLSELPGPSEWAIHALPDLSKGAFK
jgi:hypothetical protein